MRNPCLIGPAPFIFAVQYFLDIVRPQVFPYLRPGTGIHQNHRTVIFKPCRLTSRQHVLPNHELFRPTDDAIYRSGDDDVQVNEAYSLSKNARSVGAKDCDLGKSHSDVNEFVFHWCDPDVPVQPGGIVGSADQFMGHRAVAVDHPLQNIDVFRSVLGSPPEAYECYHRFPATPYLTICIAGAIPDRRDCK